MTYLLLWLLLFVTQSYATQSNIPKNIFNYDLGIKYIPGNPKKSEVTICCHGYGHSRHIVDVIHSHNVFSGDLIGFNFPDYGITDNFDHTKVVYGTINEFLPLLYLLKFYAGEQNISKINVYGFSAGGGAVVNALAVLNSYSYTQHLESVGITKDDAKTILTALAHGIIILECPLKSIQEIIDFRGVNKNLTLIARNYNNNHFNPIDTVQLLSGLTLTILLYFEKPDDVLGNRDDALFIERLRNSNAGKTDVIVGSRGGHNGYHPELWNKYNSLDLYKFETFT